MKQYIVLDFDDVIAKTMEEGFLVNVNNHQYNLSGEGAHTWELREFTQWNASATTGFNEETIERLFAEIEYKNVGEVPNAIRTIRHMITEGDSIQIVTANPNVQGIRLWLNDRGLKDVPLTHNRHKTSFMAPRGFKVIVEDKPKTLKAASNLGYHAIRFLRPWNQNLSSPMGDETVLTFDWGSRSNEHTARNWYDVYEIIRQLRTQKTNPDMPDALESLDGIINRAMTQTEEEFLSDRREILDDEVVTNENGAKQTDLKARYDLLPALAIARVAQVMHHGAEKYGEDNWRGLGVRECHNHTLGHAIAFNSYSEDVDGLEDLAHAATRALMTLELALAEWVRDGK
ncbi:MAG: hypothetical protein KAJ19_30230 [Gammaproteobacteria bacterium]|nr:hypothetical protein [Gammaproteobacteria bacterium]